MVKGLLVKWLDRFGTFFLVFGESSAVLLQRGSFEGLLGKSFRSLFLVKLVLVESALVVLAVSLDHILPVTNNRSLRNRVLLTELVDDLQRIEKSDLVDLLHLDSVGIEKEL